MSREEYIYPVEHCDTTVMGSVSIPAHPLECATLKVVHRALVIQTVKQTAPLFRERYTET
jgi:hypothetical protein